jgi:hypothetical protein
MASDLRQKILEIEGDEIPESNNGITEIQTSVETVAEIVDAPAAPDIVEEAPADWRKYRVQHVGGQYKGKLLIDLDSEEVAVIVETLEKRLAKKPEVAEEIEMMKACIKDRSETQDGDSLK